MQGPQIDQAGVIRTALVGLDMDEVCSRLSEVISTVLPHEWMRVCLAPPHENQLQVRFVMLNGTASAPKSTLPLHDSLPGQAILTGRVIVRDDLCQQGTYPDETVLTAEYGLRSSLAVPLVCSGRPVGTMEIGSTRPAAYSGVSAELIHTLGGVVTPVVEHAWQVEEGRELARINERRRLAWELHDTIIQSLTGFVLELELAERYLQSDVPRARIEIGRARDLAGACLEDARRLVLNLRPALLERSSLSDAVARELNGLSATGIEVKLSLEGSPAPLGGDVDTALYRIAQEAMANIRKHARATRVTAVLRYEPRGVKLQISDNGVGFNAGTVLNQNGDDASIGIAGARRRARLIGGDLTLDSAAGQGTTLVAEVPRERASSLSASAGDGRSGSEPRLVRVLLADNHAVVRQGLRHVLEQAQDIEVVGEADDCDRALEQVRALRPDIAVVDVQLPGMGGIDLAEVVSQTVPGTRTLILSAYGNAGLVFRAVKAGAQGYLLKEIAGSILIESIRAIQRGEMVLHPVSGNGGAADFAVAADALSPLGLTRRETEVLRLIAIGLRNKEIAGRLSLTENTVKHHVANLLAKLGADSRTEALINAQKLGILTA